ncbi:U3 small nucleolar RNA-associated protein 4 [Pelomyxa schiedti]|nr:U3 small nucleolar RNA-associated protein 4 [Pelomyxa schiedti]
MEVHRCGFVGYDGGGGVVGMDATRDGGMLAIARERGDVDVWLFGNASRPSKVTKLLGTRDGVRSVAWAPCDPPRLFSSGLNGLIVEWDICTSLPIRTEITNGGAIWSISVSHDGKHLACASDDGTVRVYQLYTFGNEPTILLEYMLPRQPAKILSVTWSVDDTRLYFGSVGTLSGWSVADIETINLTARVQCLFTNSLHLRTAVNTSFIKGNEKVAIWALCYARDTLVSGSSDGRVQFWNPLNGSLLYEYFRNFAPILCVAATPSGGEVFSSGVEPAVQSFSRSTSGLWTHGSFGQQHTHDVKAIAISNLRIASGGVDTKVVLWNKKTPSPVRFALRNPSQIRPHSHHPPLSFAKGCGRMLFHSENTLSIWQLGSCERELETGTDLRIQKPYKQVLEMKAKCMSNIGCSCISMTGKYIAFSDNTALHIIQLLPKVTRLVTPGTDKVGPSIRLLFAHTTDDILCCVSCDGSIKVVRLPELSVIHSLEPSNRNIPLAMALSPDDSHLAVSYHGSRLHVWNIAQERATRTTVPPYKNQVLALGFLPSTHGLLLIACCSMGQLFYWNIETEKMEPLNKTLITTDYQQICGINAVAPDLLVLNTEDDLIALNPNTNEFKTNTSLHGIMFVSDYPTTRTTGRFKSSLVVVQRSILDMVFSAPKPADPSIFKSF